MQVILVCQYAPCGKEFPAHSLRKYTGKFCSVACMSLGYQERHISLFWEKVQKCPHGMDCPYCCWPWMGETQNIYRNTTFHKKQTSAHRAAWQIWHKRSMVTGLHVAHYCHFRPCCNPWHLHAATPLENAADTVRDNRRPSGEKHHNSKLTNATALEAFRLRADGWYYADIAAHLNVSTSLICALIKGQTFKYLPRPSELPQPDQLLLSL